MQQLRCEVANSEVGSMNRKVEANIKKAYELIKKNVPQSIEVDSLDVVKQVEDYRQFWKPQPQARGTSQWQLENYKKYRQICARYC
jgi:hypothetical protein